MGLRCQVDQHTPARGVNGTLDDLVQGLVAVDQGLRCVARIKAHQRTVRAVGVKPHKGQLPIDEVLRQQARHHRLADAPLLATNEVDL